MKNLLPYLKGKKSDGVTDKSAKEPLLEEAPFLN